MTYDLVLYLLNSEINGIFNTCMYDLLSENNTECPEGQYMDQEINSMIAHCVKQIFSSTK